MHFRERKKPNQKEIITKKTLRYREAYGHFSNNYTRHASFKGSVNHNAILHDSSGSRRFFGHECTAIDYQHHLDMDSV